MLGCNLRSITGHDSGTVTRIALYDTNLVPGGPAEAGLAEPEVFATLMAAPLGLAVADAAYGTKSADAVIAQTRPARPPRVIPITRFPTNPSAASFHAGTGRDISQADRFNVDG